MTYQQPRLSRRTALILVIAGAVLLLGAGAAAILVVASSGDTPSSPSAVIEAASAPASPTAEPDEHVIVFEAASRDGASSLGTVIMSAADPADGHLMLHERSDRVALPFTKTMSIPGTVPDLTMWVYNDGADAVMICRIRVDGRLVREESSSGYFNNAFCRVPSQ